MVWQYMSYLDDMAISRRPYVAFAVLGAQDVTYSVAAVTAVDNYIVNVPLQGYLVALTDFAVWQVRHACTHMQHMHALDTACHEHHSTVGKLVQLYATKIHFVIIISQ
jgi:hypothetical protein